MTYKNIEITPAQYNSQHTAKQSQFYVGFSTVNATTINSTKLYDFDLIKQDLMNQFNTRKGERVMNPTFGTIIWDVLFDQFTENVKLMVTDDITRICRSDPRVTPIKISLNAQEYGLLLEITLQYKGTDQTSNMKLTFDKAAGLTAQ